MFGTKIKFVGSASSLDSQQLKRGKSTNKSVITIECHRCSQNQGNSHGPGGQLTTYNFIIE